MLSTFIHTYYSETSKSICVSFKLHGIHADNSDNFKTNLGLIALKMKMVLYIKHVKSNLCKFQKKCWNSCRQFQNKLVFNCP